MIKKDYLLINWKNGQKYDNIRWKRGRTCGAAEAVA